MGVAFRVFQSQRYKTISKRWDRRSTRSNVKMTKTRVGIATNVLFVVHLLTAQDTQLSIDKPLLPYEDFRIQSSSNQIFRFEKFGFMAKTHHSLYLISKLPTSQLLESVNTFKLGLGRARGIFDKLDVESGQANPEEAKTNKKMMLDWLSQYATDIQTIELRIENIIAYSSPAFPTKEYPGTLKMLSNMMDQQAKTYYGQGSGFAKPEVTLEMLREDDPVSRNSKGAKLLPSTVNDLYDTTKYDHRRMTNQPNYYASAPPYPHLGRVYRQYHDLGIVSPASNTKIMSIDHCKNECADQPPYSAMKGFDRYSCGFSKQELTKYALQWNQGRKLTADELKYWQGHQSENYVWGNATDGMQEGHLKLPNSFDAVHKHMTGYHALKGRRRRQADVPGVKKRKRRQVLGIALGVAALAASASAAASAGLALSQEIQLKKMLEEQAGQIDATVQQVELSDKKLNELTTRVNNLLKVVTEVEREITAEKAWDYLAQLQTAMRYVSLELRLVTDELYAGMAELSRGRFSAYLTSPKDMDEVWSIAEQLAAQKHLVVRGNPQTLFSYRAYILRHRSELHYALEVPMENLADERLHLARAAHTKFMVHNLTFSFKGPPILAYSADYGETRTLEEEQLRDCTEYGDTYHCYGTAVYQRSSPSREACLSRLLRGKLQSLDSFCDLTIAKAEEEVIQLTGTDFLILAPETVELTITCLQRAARGSPTTVAGMVLVRLRPGCKLQTDKHSVYSSYSIIRDVKFFTAHSFVSPAEVLPEADFSTTGRAQELLDQLAQEGDIPQISLADFKHRLANVHNKTFESLFAYRIELALAIIIILVLTIGCPLWCCRKRLFRNQTYNPVPASTNILIGGTDNTEPSAPPAQDFELRRLIRDAMTRNRPAVHPDDTPALRL